MAEKIDASLPAGIVIGDGWQIVFAAVDPTTGDDVAGVVVSNANVVASDSGGTTGLEQPHGPFMLVPGPNG